MYGKRRAQHVTPKLLNSKIPLVFVLLGNSILLRICHVVILKYEG